MSVRVGRTAPSFMGVGSMLKIILALILLAMPAMAVPPQVMLDANFGIVVGATITTYDFSGSENYWSLHALCRDEVDSESHWCSVFEVMNTTEDPGLPPGKMWVRTFDFNFENTFRQNCNGFGTGSPGTMWTVNDNAVFKLEACPTDPPINLPLICCIN